NPVPRQELDEKYPKQGIEKDGFPGFQPPFVANRSFQDPAYGSDGRQSPVRNSIGTWPLLYYLHPCKRLEIVLQKLPHCRASQVLSDAFALRVNHKRSVNSRY